MSFAPATRRKAKLRLGVSGPSGSGKTFGLIKLALGICPAEKIFFIDSERGSASLYAHLGKFNVKELTDDFSPQVYTASIKEAEAAGAEFIIIDSLSHAWEGKGGALDMVEAATARSKSGNSYTAWKEITPAHRELVDAMLQSSAHVGMAMRVKTEYVIEKDDRGKSTPRKVGLAPIQRQGLEYEATIFFEIDEAHNAVTTKDRTGLFDGKRLQLNEGTGQALKAWLESGADPLPVAAPAPVAPKVADVAASAEILAPHAAALQKATTLDELKAAWSSVPKALQPALVAVKDDVKKFLSNEVK